MLYRTIKRLIEMGKIDGLSEKIDVFYAAEKLIESEYNEFVEMLNNKN